ncbi:VOC family protein [Aeromicrobium endophyticum]|nr:VOC family protein [Aeromicrobium endophyticum]
MSNAGITSIFHVNIITRDMDRAIKWYTEVLGASLIDGPYDGEGLSTRAISFGLDGTGVEPEDVKIRYALLGWGEGEDQTFLDLIESVNPASFGSVHPSVLHVGLRRICFTVESVQKSADFLVANGVELLTPIVEFDATEGPLEGHACVCFTDPDGTVLEVFGPM